QNRQRIQAWRQEMKNHLFTPIGTVAFSGLTTLDRLTPEQAAALPMRPFPAGTKWGACWEYAWFAAEITLPAECDGHRVVLLPGLGGEQLIYVDGQAAGSNDKGRDYVTLRHSARADERIRVLIESYAGHGARLENMGPCPPERAVIPPVPDAQCSVKPSILALWNEDAYQLYLDVEILCDLLGQLDEKSLRYQKVAQSLLDFTVAADFELPPAARHESFRRARAALRPALLCRNGSTAPVMWLLGQSHIDLAWLWPEEETWHKVARTYANQLALMDEYPEYRFLLCEPRLLDMLRLQHPALWTRVLAAFRRGQIDADGAFYVECDTNLPCGESLIRQLIKGKRWFRTHFGVDSRVAWQPDTFGYSGVLPQILSKLNIPYFATQKLLRADPECERFPYQNFVWEGIDGSTVQALSFFKNNAQLTPSQFVQRWNCDRVQQTNIDTLLYPFGFGDGGGGANRDMLEAARRMGDLEGLPRAHYGSLRGFFEETARQAEGNRWVGELYLNWHRGTYTTQRKTKQRSAQLERYLHDAEALLALLPGQERAEYLPVLDKAWDVLMFCQFHDVAGGVGIRRVHQEAEAALTAQGEAVQQLIGTLAERLPQTRIPHSFAPTGEDACITETPEGFLMENALLRVTIDRQGAITSITDKRSGLPLMNPGQKMNDWRLYENVEPVYDAWEMSRDWQQRRLDADLHAACRIYTDTLQQAALAVTYQFGESRVEMFIRLFAGDDKIQVDAEVDWHERRKLLKVHFESNVLCDDALHEIQFGHVKRPCHASHAFAADRYESCSNRWTALCEENRGFAVLTEDIRGVSTDRGEMALSLLRAPLVPDDTADRGEHQFSYAIMPFATAFKDSGVVRAGYAFNQPVYLAGPWDAFRVDAGFSCDSDAMIIETVKPADDGSDDIILRLYESLRTHATGTLRLPFAARVYESTMDETETGALLGEGRALPLSLKPFEIRTLRLVR
ncbi:MAG: glycoside hydrolase family 38 C-terminal domain-containing protein, partial [Clostridiales bacterium]|nr:glycoside hydrolase family 38 C-terminal domain-containing protein [Clostridiales bacterium]